ncbi:uncharacterized protein LOC134933186 isoform X3 [Pseudophryne corroboree]|uniref:uncharacterized protein LOC134933186 isoform X3 n=1 Tax=Pseudophryne corroboree TaxID=495146 RepID=UPI00308183D8
MSRRAEVNDLHVVLECIKTICRKLYKIKEIEMSKVENIPQASTSKSEDESVNAWREDRPLSPDLLAKKVQMKSQSTTGLMNSENSSGFTMPSNVSSVSLVSPYYESDFLDSSDAQSYCSSPETVRGFDPLNVSKCESDASLLDQTRWKKKNSTLLEISNAMPINELIGPAEFFMFSPITNNSSFYPSKSYPTQLQDSEKYLVSTLVSGKPLCKIKGNGKTTATNERPSLLPEAVPATENLLTYTPQNVVKATKIVTFGSPLATVIPCTELTDDEDDFCHQMDTEPIPTRAEVSLLFKNLFEKHTEMFIHHPFIHLLSESGRHVRKDSCTARTQRSRSSHEKCRVLNKRSKSDPNANNRPAHLRIDRLENIPIKISIDVQPGDQSRCRVSATITLMCLLKIIFPVRRLSIDTSLQTTKIGVKLLHY